MIACPACGGGLAHTLWYDFDNVAWASCRCEGAMSAGHITIFGVVDREEPRDGISLCALAISVNYLGEPMVWVGDRWSLVSLPETFSARHLHVVRDNLCVARVIGS